MKRPNFWSGLAASAFLAIGVSLLDLGCYVQGTCGTRLHRGHTDEHGNPDPCCFSALPCCANPLWGRTVEINGLLLKDPCCLEDPCPLWDVNKGADAGADGASSAPENDAGPAPDAGPERDAAADGGP
jgi:hypothetical protein